jgi:Flp pilus assembly protein TadG
MLQKIHQVPVVRTRRRRGAVVMESILVITILLMLTLAVIEFGVAVSVQNAISQATIKGAREAGKGADIDDVVSVVNNVLAPHNITIGNGAGLLLEDPAALFQDSRGDVTCQPPAAALNNGFVRLTVGVSATRAPLLRTLETFGMCSFVDRMFQFSAAVKRECPG